ncbi:MAG: SH3 domain-containing protein, partial [Chloroflexaceae bacterium]|nr:SH3 domain-containing protein [Chloroflexaceae bacterium]
VLLLTLVVVGSYIGAGFVVDRLFAIRLPGLGDFGLPQINLPTLNLDVPDWLNRTEPGDILIVNISSVEGLNVRDAPGLSTNVIATVPSGTRVRKLEGPTVVDDVPWVRGRIDREGAQPLEGWMSQNFLEQES